MTRSSPTYTVPSRVNAENFIAGLAFLQAHRNMRHFLYFSVGPDRHREGCTDIVLYDDYNYSNHFFDSYIGK